MKITEVDSSNIMLDKSEVLHIFKLISQGKHTMFGSFTNDLSRGISGIKNTASKFKSAGKGLFNGDKKRVGEDLVNEKLSPDETYNEMVRVWQKMGSPLDFGSIRWMLKKSFNVSDEQITRVINQTRKDSPQLVDLAKQIVDAGISDIVLNILNNPYLASRKPEKYNRNKSESVQNTKNVLSEAEEKTYSDQVLKQLFADLAQNQLQTGSEGTTNDGLVEYFKLWKNEFDSADQNAKQEIVSNMVNKLSELYKKQDWETVSKQVIDVLSTSDEFNTAIDNIRRGKVNESVEHHKVKRIVEMNTYGRYRR